MNRRLRILSSEDDEAIRSFLFNLLTEHGHEVEFARGSDELFKNIGKAKYDLLILDVNTPGTNGYKVAEKLSGNISNRPKILIFTARNIKEEELQFALCGSDAIIPKGASCDRIMGTIEALFSREGSVAPPRRRTEPPMHESQDTAKPEQAGEKLKEDLQRWIDRMTRVEDLVNIKNLRYEEFIRDLLKEKQRTEKNYLEFKRIEEQVVRIMNWGYAVSAVAVLALLKSFL